MAGLHCSLFAKAGVSGVELNPDAPPGWSHNRDWGYAPTGGLGLILATSAAWSLVGTTSRFGPVFQEC
jgi:hypothetical protein